MVVVAEHGVYRRELCQCGEHRQVGDVTGVEDLVGHAQAIAQEIREPVGLSRPEVRIGEHEGFHRITVTG